MSLRIIPSANRYGRGISEFTSDRTLNGTCTQTALEICVAATEDRDPSPAKMVGYVRDMAARGWCSPNGAARLDYTAHYAREVLRKPILKEIDYANRNVNEEIAEDWHALLVQHAGIHPILMQVAYGARLVDKETAVRDEAAGANPPLRYHAIAVVGKDERGYICADGDHPQVTTRFQVYDYDRRDAAGNIVNSLRAAIPCGLIIFDMPPSAPTPAPKPTTSPLTTPSPDPAAALRAALTDIVTRAQSALKG
ncbi:MAG: hypothetical protein H0X24_19395 [Ktedonobacterales bacterium]|nr:hypothetical protein [Ktedonobacterales bacterium]